MFRKSISLASAKRIAATVTGLVSAGDPATAEALRRWFNATFAAFTLEKLTDDDGRISGYRLTSALYPEALQETATRQPGAKRPRRPEPETDDEMPGAIRAAFRA